MPKKKDKKEEVYTTFYVEDGVNTLVTREAKDILDEIFCFPYTFYKQMPYGGKKQIKTVKTVISKGKVNCNMPTGLVPIAVSYLKSKGITVKLEGYHEKLKFKKPSLPGITFRKDQMEAIKSILFSDWQRGVLIAPTGTGKTITALGLISALYPKHKILILAHTRDLVDQFYEELIKFGFKNVSVLKGKDYKFGNITLSTDKKLANINPKEYCTMFDAVIVDEFHHCSGFSTQYAKILSTLAAPIKVGITATLPDSVESQLAMKSFAGPVQYELTMHKAQELNLITVPKVKMFTYKPVEKDYDVRKYSDIYNKFIVDNRNRNNLILDIAEYHISKQEPVLICVKTLEHIDKLLKLAKLKKLAVYGAQGKTHTDERKEIITNMKNKKYLCCIATKVFDEGINIPSLQVVINAGSGKSKIQNLQKPGRGTRLSKGKESMTLIDFIDPYTYLSSHSCERMMLYAEQNWDIEVINPMARKMFE